MGIVWARFTEHVHAIKRLFSGHFDFSISFPIWLQVVSVSMLLPSIDTQLILVALALGFLLSYVMFGSVAHVVTAHCTHVLDDYIKRRPFDHFIHLRLDNIFFGLEQQP
jgi:hypothetical protein